MLTVCMAVRLCACVCLCRCACVCNCVCACLCVHLWVCICMFECANVCPSVCVCPCICVCTYACVCVHVCGQVCVSMYTCVHLCAYACLRVRRTCSPVFLVVPSVLKQQQWSVSSHSDRCCSWQLQKRRNSLNSLNLLIQTHISGFKSVRNKNTSGNFILVIFYSTCLVVFCCAMSLA